jgi:ABC-type glycerol-3-phosphate transport system permease component
MNMSRHGRVIAVYLVLCIAMVFTLLPIVWGISTSFKPLADVHAKSQQWWPANPTFENYRIAVFNGRFLTYLTNTLWVVAITLVVSLTLAAHAAYAVARTRFVGRSTLMMIMWITIMIPGIAIIVPLYLLAVKVQLYDTLWSLILVYSAWLIPTLVWLLRGFVVGIPVELEEAAQIDGCTPLGAFYRIVLPLMRPGLMAGSVLVFVMIWNEFLISYALTLSDENRLIQVGIYFFITDSGIEWGPLMAASVGSVLPIVAAYAIAQKAFIQGLTGGAVKG